MQKVLQGKKVFKEKKKNFVHCASNSWSSHPQYIALSNSPLCEVAWADMSIVYLYTFFLSSLYIVFAGIEPVNYSSAVHCFSQMCQFLEGRGQV